MTRKQSNHTADLNICVIFCLRRQLGGLVGRAPSVTMLVQSRPPPILPLLSLGNPPSSSRRPLRLRSVLQSTCCFVHFTLRGDWAPRRRFSADCVLRVLAVNVFILPAASEHAGPALCGPCLSWTCQCIAGLNIVRMSYLRPRVLSRLATKAYPLTTESTKPGCESRRPTSLRCETMRNVGQIRRAGMNRLRIFVSRCFRVLSSRTMLGSSCLRLQADRLSSP